MNKDVGEGSDADMIPVKRATFKAYALCIVLPNLQNMPTRSLGGRLKDKY